MILEILQSAIDSEPDMAIVGNRPAGLQEDDDWLAAYTRRRHIDVVVLCASRDNVPVQDRITGLLRANARLGVVAIDGARGTGTLHRLVQMRDAIEPLAASTLADAIRAGAGQHRDRGTG